LGYNSPIMAVSGDTVPVGREDIIRLRRDLVAAGAFEPARAATILKFSGHIILAGLAAWICIRGPLWVLVLLTPVCALSWVIAVMIGHDATHRATFRSPLANATLRSLAFPLLSGMSGLFWRYKHNVLHHTNPNVIGYDEDLEVLPFAIGRPFHLGSSRTERWIQKHIQCAWLFWPMTTMLPWDLRSRSVRYLISHLRAKGVSAEWSADVAMILCHWTFFVVLPCVFVGVKPTLVFYSICWAIAGSYLAIVGLAGHTALPLFESYDEHVAVQFYTTRSLNLGSVMSWCFVGLDRQIEHHLFPQISHFRLKRATPVVKAFAAEHGLPYCEDTLLDCLRGISAYVNRSWDDSARRLQNNTLLPVADAPIRPTWGRLRPDHLNHPATSSSEDNPWMGAA
jgi:fatty acid desaturase